MKTVVEHIKEKLTNIGFTNVDEFFAEFLTTEKQQHEKTAIAITNIFMDALDNPKGGKFNGEEEFNNYWNKTYNV